MSTSTTWYAIGLLGLIPWTRGIAQNLAAVPDTIPGTAVTFAMVRVHAGDGLPRDLWVGRTEVTWEMFDVFVFRLDQAAPPAPGVEAIARPSKPYVVPGSQFGHQGWPALAMSYPNAEAFAAWLAARTGRKYRLPTEAEWEALCRRGEAGAKATLAERAWHWDNAEDRTHRVATARPDGLGLYDLLGNVAEWVMGRDGVPVIKGGAWQDDAAEVHCGARKAQTPGWNASDPQLPKSRWWLPDAPFVGFRLVRDP